MLKPTKLEISNVRTFAGSHELALHQSLTVLVGANNSGKTALLRALVYIGMYARGYTRPDTVLRTGAPVPEARLIFPISSAELLRQFPDFENRIRDYAPHLPDFVSLRNEHACLVEHGMPLGELRFGANALIFQTKILRLEKDGTTFEPPSGPQGNQEELGAALNLTKNFVRALGFWCHATLGADEIGTGAKRFSGTEENGVISGMTFLRLNHPDEFDRLQEAVSAAFPEVGSITFVEKSGGSNVYTPHLSLAGIGKDQPIERANFGAGAWIFLCVLAATRVAYATGARLMLLDEPTLFMHPRLERLLLRELTAPDRWGPDGPMQLIVATHSPILIDAAFRHGGLRIVEWEDQRAARARIKEIPTPQELQGQLPLLSVAPSDIFYSDTLLFVEGPSDVAALNAFSVVTDNPCRILALHETDWYGSRPKEQRFTVLSRLSQVLTGAQMTRARLLVDADKRHFVEAALDKLHASQKPVALYAGAGNSDLESLFCELDLLTHFFEQERADPNADVRTAIGAALTSMATSETNGSTVLYKMFEELCEERECKPDQLGRVARFLVKHRAEKWAASAWDRLRPIRNIIDASTQSPIAPTSA